MFLEVGCDWRVAVGDFSPWLAFASALDALLRAMSMLPAP
jgi:hypothetical protein